MRIRFLRVTKNSKVNRLLAHTPLPLAVAGVPFRGVPGCLPACRSACACLDARSSRSYCLWLTMRLTLTPGAVLRVITSTSDNGQYVK